MRISPLRLWTLFTPDDVPMLRRPADPVNHGDLVHRDHQKLIDGMIATMRRAQGIGLAAPQVGRSLRIAVISRDVDDRLRDDLVFVNPTLSVASPKPVTIEEGCLSIPNVFGDVVRPDRISVSGFDRQGHRLTMDADGLLARVLQHEFDHLNGILFIDRAERITKGAELLP